MWLARLECTGQKLTHFVSYAPKAFILTNSGLRNVFDAPCITLPKAWGQEVLLSAIITDRLPDRVFWTEESLTIEIPLLRLPSCITIDGCPQETTERITLEAILKDNTINEITTDLS